MNYLIPVLILIGIGFFIKFQLKKNKKKEVLIFTPQLEIKLALNELTIISEINNYRDINNLPVLLIENLHCKLARKRVNYFLSIGKITHDLFYKHNTILTDRGISCAENVSYGYSSEMSVINAWKKSESHRNNLLKKEWKYVGVAKGVDKNRKYYYCLILGFKK